MPRTAPALIATLAVIEERPTGDRARYTIPVRTADAIDIDTAAARAEAIRSRIATECGNPVRIDTHKAA